METIFPLTDSWRLLCALATAFVLGTAIGLERQWRQRTAGLRTNVLVAVGAAAFVDLGVQTAGQDGGARVIAYVVSGIGFLGAGVIMKEGTQVRGLNTAATLWTSAAVGAFAGVGRLAEAAVVAGFVLAGNTMLRPLVDFVNRRPIAERHTEALYRVHVVCAPERVSMARPAVRGAGGPRLSGARDRGDDRIGRRRRTGRRAAADQRGGHRPRPDRRAYRAAAGDRQRDLDGQHDELTRGALASAGAFTFALRSR